MIRNMTYFRQFKILTTPDHSLVISGRSTRLETITNEFSVSVYLYKLPPYGTKIHQNRFRQFRPKIEMTRKKRVPGRILKNGFLHSIPEGLEKTNAVGT